jgi:sterol desaturase/sphingolipid hydroxylase (fatty acid hydroxylase superfamily)
LAGGYQPSVAKCLEMRFPKVAAWPQSARYSLMPGPWRLCRSFSSLSAGDPLIPISRYSPSGLFVDMLWFITFPVFGVSFPYALRHLLNATLGSAVGAFRLQTVATLPLTLQFVVVILLSDFLAWLGHYIRHKIPVFWEFHQIHHSQSQLNYFSSRRNHPLDSLANTLIQFLPFTLLGLDLALPGFLAWKISSGLFEMFVHSNIRTNLGFLRYVLVTPQTHRVHHSVQPEHFDKNFGNVFAIWDFLFRTQCKDFNVYPALGVADAKCPRGKATTLQEALRVFASELAYPLRAVFRLPGFGNRG